MFVCNIMIQSFMLTFGQINFTSLKFYNCEQTSDPYTALECIISQ